MSEQRCRRRGRGFSLLEVTVALAIAAVIITILMDLLVEANKGGRKTRVRSQLANAGAVVNQQLRQELALAGLGVPSGVNIATGATDQIASVVLVASATEVGVLGDFPRPDANFSTFGLLDDRPPASERSRHVAWHNENNGNCMPTSAVGGCTTADTSVFFPGETGCKTTASAPGDRTCPWGMLRLRGAEPFQVVAGNKQWFSASNNAVLTVHDHGAATMLVIDTGNTFPVAWTNDGPSSLPNGGAGQGWVTTLDRIFYRFNAGARTVERIQCWGVPKPADPLWPAATATTAGTGPCAAPFEGMAAYEVVASDVDSLAFTYFDGADVVVALPINTIGKKKSVRRVEYTMVLSKNVNGQPVKHEVVGASFLGMAI
jgi:prepilin-type N-terminal cleavage/methylation domain-containing protein